MGGGERHTGPIPLQGRALKPYGLGGRREGRVEYSSRVPDDMRTENHEGQDGETLKMFLVSLKLTSKTKTQKQSMHFLCQDETSGTNRLDASLLIGCFCKNVYINIIFSWKIYNMRCI